jgi:hypothetical protein
MLFRVMQITEEYSVPAKSGAVNLRFANNREAHGLVQKRPAGVTFLGNI